MSKTVQKAKTLSDGKKVTTYTKKIDGCFCSLEAEVGTTGYQSGDSGHGCRTYFRIKNYDGAAMQVNSCEKHGHEEIEMLLGGDYELYSIIEALRFITNVLEKKAEETKAKL